MSNPVKDAGLEPDATMVPTLQTGTRLSTRDGRKIGNAIVIGAASYTPRTTTMSPLSCWLIETDFGNRLTLLEAELAELFYIDAPTDLDQWRIDRAEKVNGEATGIAFAPTRESGLERLPRVWGVGRDAENAKALVVSFERELTDNEIREFHLLLTPQSPRAIRGAAINRELPKIGDLK